VVYDPEKEAAAVRAAEDEYAKAYEAVQADMNAELDVVRERYDGRLQEAVDARDAALAKAHRAFYESQIEALEDNDQLEQGQVLRDLLVTEEVQAADA
jgi:hypothetical protein